MKTPISVTFRVRGESLALTVHLLWEGVLPPRDAVISQALNLLGQSAEVKIEGPAR
jgi:hypothetical protein